MQTQIFGVRSLLANFTMSCDPKWQNLARRLPLVAWFVSFSITSVAFLKLFEVDRIGPWIFIDVALVSTLGAVPLMYAVAQYFVVRQTANEIDLAAHDQGNNWRPLGLLFITFAVALLTAKVLRSVAA